MIPATLLPGDLQATAFIAGGYAACPALAQDMDVWVRVDTGETLPEARQRILMWLEETMWPYEQVDDSARLGAVDSGSTVDTAGTDVFVLRVAIVHSQYLTHSIHIMVTNASPAELLETFDISTHAIALAFGNVVKAEGWTPITAPPKVLKMTPTTPARLEKIVTRYDFEALEDSGQVRFPPHKASLTLEHNAYKDYYYTIEQAVKELEDSQGTDILSLSNRDRVLETGELWTLQWYPITPVGFNFVAGPTLDSVLAQARA